jgi:hypothetical protein
MRLLLVFGSVLLAAAALGLSPARADAKAPAQVAADRAAEISAARKKKRAVRRYDREYEYGHLEPYRSFGFIGRYPGEYAWRKSIGQNVCDLGYGRWDMCDRR